MDIFFFFRNESEAIVNAIVRFARWVASFFREPERDEPQEIIRCRDHYPRGGVFVSRVAPVVDTPFFHELMSRYGVVQRIVEMRMLEHEWRFLVVFDRDEDARRAVEEIPKLPPCVATRFQYNFVEEERLEPNLFVFDRCRVDYVISTLYND